MLRLIRSPLSRGPEGSTWKVLSCKKNMIQDSLEVKTFKLCHVESHSCLLHTCSFGWTSSNWTLSSAKKSSSISAMKMALYTGFIMTFTDTYYQFNCQTDLMHAVTWFIGSVSLVDTYTSMKTVIVSLESMTLSWAFKMFCPKLMIMPYIIQSFWISWHTRAVIHLTHQVCECYSWWVA